MERIPRVTIHGSESEYQEYRGTYSQLNQDGSKTWDRAKRGMPNEEERESTYTRFVLGFIKPLKVLTYVLAFAISLGGAVLARFTFLLMTSQVQVDRMVTYCWGDGDNYMLEAKIPELERVSWSWAIFFCFAASEMWVFLRALRMCIFKKVSRPSNSQWIIPAIFETFHTVGLAIFAFVIVPSMNVVLGAMLPSAISAIPYVFSLLGRNLSDERSKMKLILVTLTDFIGLLSVLAGLIVWSLFKEEPTELDWLLPISCVLISCKWWENYADPHSPFRITGLVSFLGNVNLHPDKSVYITYLFLPFWKMAVFCLGMVVSHWILNHRHPYLFRHFYESFSTHTVEIVTQSLTSGNYSKVMTIDNESTAVDYAILIQVASAFACYLAGKFACKTGIQKFGFAAPLTLAGPLTVLSLGLMCQGREANSCYASKLLPPYLFWDCTAGGFTEIFIEDKYAWAYILWFLGHLWVTIHIWKPEFRRLSSSEVLFVTPGYTSLLVDQSLTLNRRRKDIPIQTSSTEDLEEEMGHSYSSLHSFQSSSVLPEDTIPHIYACITMWHEQTAEMMETLKSIFLLDEDQAARRIARTFFDVEDPDYYEFETHVFFDDAFNRKGTQVNQYVKDFVNSMEKAAYLIYDTELADPEKYSTPYGGKMVWQLPGGTSLTCHLKNKNYIRHKKRWSQVMYMYYILGHKLMGLEIPTARKEVISENTFLLALDGDIAFKPTAVTPLLDLMKKNKGLGAACGRIHPIGSGLMGSYQKFEYAIGHWFQKAAEHVIGCVLCSPGCFSLFRGKSLLDVDVLAKYTTLATEPLHYLQYDQGEDRWLCTLLLQQGYRVEYCAASDALTHAPESFDEFFNQRRRWIPSTMANIWNLLQDYQRTTRKNPNISSLYLAYQLFLLVGSILGPGTIFLMLTSVFSTTFGLSLWVGFTCNAISLVIFVISGFFCKQKTQLLIAHIISTVYVIIMVAVAVGIAVQIVDEGVLSPTSLFFFFVAGSFIIAGLLHPLEISCLPHGLVYYLTVPAMYLILILYSLMNLHDVSWGTRDDGVSGNQSQKPKRKKFGLDESEWNELSYFERLCTICCVRRLELNVDLNKVLEAVENGQFRKLSDGRRNADTSTEDTVPKQALAQDQNGIRAKTPAVLPVEWIQDPDLKYGEVMFLTKTEVMFWKELLQKYLRPLDADAVKQAKVVNDLRALRNRSTYVFFLINAVFVSAVFFLQKETDTFSFEWPFGGTTYITDDGSEVTENLHLEPIGTMFVAVFGLILLIQFLAMLYHRLGTFAHIMASTKINWFGQDKSSMVPREFELVDLVRIMTKYRDRFSPANQKSDPELKVAARVRETIHQIKKSGRKRKLTNIELAFNETFEGISESRDLQNIIIQGNRQRKLTLDELIRRRRLSAARLGSISFEKTNLSPITEKESDSRNRTLVYPSPTHEGFSYKWEVTSHDQIRVD